MFFCLLCLQSYRYNFSQANYLKSIGVKKGDSVVIYMSLTPELPIAMLACTRLGAVHSVVFGGFSAESLSQRIVDSRCSNTIHLRNSNCNVCQFRICPE